MEAPMEIEVDLDIQEALVRDVVESLIAGTIKNRRQFDALEVNFLKYILEVSCGMNAFAMAAMILSGKLEVFEQDGVANVRLPGVCEGVFTASHDHSVN